MPRPPFLSRRRPDATVADPSKKSVEAVSADEGDDGEESVDSLFDALDAPPEGGDPELGVGIDEVVDEGIEDVRLGSLADPGIAARHGLTRPRSLRCPHVPTRTRRSPHGYGRGVGASLCCRPAPARRWSR
jgi:hypothetical protein